METKVTAKENQHEILRSLLLEAGWLDVKLWIFPLGTLGAIHSLSPVQPGCSWPDTGCSCKAPREAVPLCSARRTGHLRKKRELERELWGDPQ